MRYRVLLSNDALSDLAELRDHIAEHDSPSAADRLLAKIDDVLASLEQFPERGAWPRELSSLGIRRYRQTAFKPYRIIYRIEGHDVLVLLVADGRRDMQTLLIRRLMAG